MHIDIVQTRLKPICHRRVKISSEDGQISAAEPSSQGCITRSPLLPHRCKTVAVAGSPATVYLCTCGMVSDQPEMYKAMDCEKVGSRDDETFVVGKNGQANIS